MLRCIHQTATFLSMILKPFLSKDLSQCIYGICGGVFRLSILTATNTTHEIRTVALSTLTAANITLRLQVALSTLTATNTTHESVHIDSSKHNTQVRGCSVQIDCNKYNTWSLNSCSVHIDLQVGQVITVALSPHQPTMSKVNIEVELQLRPRDNTL